MIRTWRLARFKSVVNETSLTFAPLTIFAGANSAGKSTIIQSILLTAQTLQSTLESRAVILNGHIARLGAFRDVVSDNASMPSVMIGFELDIAPDANRGRLPRMARHRYRPMYRRGVEEDLHIECQFSFSATASGEHSELLQLQPELEYSRISASARIADNATVEAIEFQRADKTGDVRARELGLSEQSQVRAAVDTLRWEVLDRRGALPQFADRGKAVGVSVNHFLPDALSIVYDAVDEEVRYALNALTASEQRFSDPRRDRAIELPAGVQRLIRDAVLEVAQEFEERSAEPIHPVLRAELAPLMDKLLDAAPDRTIAALARLQREVPAPIQVAIGNKLLEKRETLRELLRGGRDPQMEMRFAPLPELLAAAVDALQHYFAYSVRYLGPLRDEPKPIYPLSAASDTRDVGFRGEHTASVLDVHSRTIVSFIPSPSVEGSNRGALRAPLIDAVLHWLRYMGIGSNVKTRDRGKLGHDLRVSAAGSGALHDLTHVGVGVSQVLPILVLSLLADTGATLIFEQPELHLHPRVQTRLADFFVSMTQLGKQCVVETHSEYLINRLRYRAATAEGNALSSSVVMYFVEKPEGESVYREVRINEFGVIEDWPQGFFDENEEVAAEILRAGMQKRRTVSRGKDA